MTEELKKEQEDLASLQFSEIEIKKITGHDVDVPSFDKGRLKAQAEVRKSILKLATQGSSPAQKQFLDLINSDSVPKKEIDSVLKWAKKEDDQYSIGIVDTIDWIFNKKKSPKKLCEDQQ